MSAEVSERQALSSLMRCSRSRDPIMTYDSLYAQVASRCRRQACRLASTAAISRSFSAVSGWEWSEKRLTRLRSCVGMSTLLEWFVSLSHDGLQSLRRPSPRKDGGEMRIRIAYALLCAMGGSSKMG